MSEKPSPILHAPRPAFRVDDFQQALEHYVDWLGFNLDSQWQEAPGQPAIGFLSRDYFTFMINEHPSAQGPISVHMDVSNLEALVEEWNRRRPDSVFIHRAPPYEFPEVVIEDPWGNCFFFEGKDEAQEAKNRDLIRTRMRDHVDQLLAAGGALPTPEELRQAIGPPLGVAVEVLNQYPEYGELFRSRQAAEKDGD